MRNSKWGKVLLLNKSNVFLSLNRREFEKNDILKNIPEGVNFKFSPALLCIKYSRKVSRNMTFFILKYDVFHTHRVIYHGA